MLSDSLTSRRESYTSSSRPLRSHNLTYPFLKRKSEEVYWKDFHNSKQKWNRQMDIQYDKHIYCRNGKWVIIITLYDTKKKFPDPNLKNMTLAEQLKQIRLTDSWVQQMKTTCHNGKHLKGERLGFACKREYQSTQFPLAGPCNDMYTSSQSLKYDRKLKQKIHWAITHIGNRWSVDGTFSASLCCCCCCCSVILFCFILISVLEQATQWVGEDTE